MKAFQCVECGRLFMVGSLCPLHVFSKAYVVDAEYAPAQSKTEPATQPPTGEAEGAGT